MQSKYIFRLDDASHFSDLKKWQAIEDIFQQYNIMPIVAVTPDNKDHTIMYQEENPDFWKLVKKWETKGWEVAMHGYQHLYHNVQRKKLIIPYYDRSEFAELSLSEQETKIKKSREIFRKNGFDPTVWVAPGHSFDSLTLNALANETNIKIISDGISLSTYYKNNFHFIPQQLWQIKKFFFGVWTICLHPDTMTDCEIDNFRSQISCPDIHKNTIRVKDLDFSKSDKNIIDRCYSAIYWGRYKIANFLRPIKKILING